MVKRGSSAMNDNYSFQIRVTGILLRNDKILLVKQQVGKRAWSLPGGRLEHGESLEQGVIREIYEETGLIVAVDKLLYICDVTSGKHIHITLLLSYISGEITLPDNSHDENPISDVVFTPLDELEQYGFSAKFRELVQNGFPGAGNYMGGKENIGLG
jgi:ADP-ribose pyrophosphatase YjhB (NUDIX family)